MNTTFQQRLQGRLKGKPGVYSLRHISDCTWIRLGCDSHAEEPEMLKGPGRRSAAWQKTGEDERMNESGRRGWDISEDAAWAEI